MPTPLDQKRHRLLETVRSYGSCLVAFSAGVDSTVLAKAAKVALGDRAVAATGTSASLASGHFDEAVALARRIGIRHEIVNTAEFADPKYLRNSPDRCYHCKTELYTRLKPLADKLGLAVIANGANVDDLGDYRPGMTAAEQHGVRSPLVECGISKSDVREAGRLLEFAGLEQAGLAVPLQPCRLWRGSHAVRLQMIDSAEQLLRTLGLRTVRVRYHRGDLARLEVPPEAIETLAGVETRSHVLAALREIGFKYVTLDLAGFRSAA